MTFPLLVAILAMTLVYINAVFTALKQAPFLFTICPSLEKRISVIAEITPTVMPLRKKRVDCQRHRFPASIPIKDYILDALLQVIFAGITPNAAISSVLLIEHDCSAVSDPLFE